MAPTKKIKKPTKASQASLLKQKTKDEAELVVAELKRISQQPQRYAEMISDVTVPEMVNSPIDLGNSISMASQASQASILKQKTKDDAKSIVAELKRISKQPKRYADMISDVTVSEMVNSPIELGSPISMAQKNETTKKPGNGSYIFEKNKVEAAIVAIKCISQQPTRLQNRDVLSKSDVSTTDVVSKTVNSSEIIDLTANVASTSTGNSSAVPAKAKEKFVYEINCEGVSESVRVAELKQFIQEQLKVSGKKDNCGNTVTICCRDSIVEIRSKTYLPKRYLRFLCKKFLKRNANIQVVSNGPKSYELKYYGAT